MKRIGITIGLLAGALLLLWPLAQAEQDSGETVVTWTIEGCTIELEAPEEIELGTATPGAILTSDPKEGEAEIESTCAYTVTINLVGFTKDGDAVSGDLLNTLLAQYSFRTESVSPASQVDNLQPDYTTFGSIGDVKNVCGSKTTAKPPFKNHKCDLQFRVDTTSLPEGEYSAYHIVTASTP
jgi:hypothetical protein